MAIKVGGSMNELDWLSSASKHVRRGRIIALALMLVLFARLTPYSSRFCMARLPRLKKRFRKRGATRRRLYIYLELLRVEPVREAIEVRLDFSTSTRPDGRHFPNTSPIDLIVDVSDGADVQEVKLQAG